jgi:hypothetical protein
VAGVWLALRRAGLMVRSASRLRRLAPSPQPNGVLGSNPAADRQAQVSPTRQRITPVQAAAFQAARHLSRDGPARWRQAIARYLARRPGMRQLDLGAGTGM